MGELVRIHHGRHAEGIAPSSMAAVQTVRSRSQSCAGDRNGLSLQPNTFRAGNR